ncbi:aspartate kinase [Gammaproteobacteria bacterium]|jgi:aspartate kinase|nr:aspartate kinase [Gammaproteobacteria bacterium]MDA8733528.1 aspartate kinase [Gammaproteobacteria bacterium]MDA9562099.1 aspartate kinase [Gammaproteobacteria bacterium]MDA9759486.1 aspartate kinase [Gammaproteobacteria bacterium]MDA9765789.1 aspartate kinase [Gammaproteobacteria bacterium]
MPNIIVQKFGGTSVGSEERIASVAKIVQKASLDNSIVVVVSAMSGETNRLISLAKSFGDNPSRREFDALISTGEKVSAALLAMALQQIGVPAKSFSASQISMKTTSTYSKARILDVDGKKIQETLDAGIIPIITGFQGITESGDVTTLGRGGSDTTAVAIAAQMKAERCDIYTDVDGIYTTDPRIVPEAKKLDTITMEEMLEMAGQGAKVIQIRAVEFANKYKVPVRVLSSFESGNGTLISLEENNMENGLVSGIAFQKDQIKFTLHGVSDTPGMAYGILGPLSDANIEVDVIVQNVSVNGKTDFTFTVSKEDEIAATDVIHNLRETLEFDDLLIDSSIAKVSLVGVGMRSHAGIASSAFKALSEAGINIQMISTSEIKITIVIKEDETDQAVGALHNAFELEK